MSLPPFDQSVTSKYTSPPNPNWSYGKGLESQDDNHWMAGEEKGWKVVDASTEDPRKLYPLLISGIVPRPVAFVSTISKSGVENLAPFSWFNMVTHDPPIVSICCSSGPARLKDTAQNIKDNKGFTVNIISEPWVENANMCSIDAPEDIGEWPVSGLTKEKSLYVQPARVKESAFSIECELFQTIEITSPTNGSTTTMILGLIKYVHVRKDMLTERGTMDATKFKPIARMGDITYARVGDLFRLPRPTWAQEGEKIDEALKVKGPATNGNV